LRSYTHDVYDAVYKLDSMHFLSPGLTERCEPLRPLVCLQFHTINQSPTLALRNLLRLDVTGVIWIRIFVLSWPQAVGKAMPQTETTSTIAFADSKSMAVKSAAER